MVSVNDGSLQWVAGIDTSQLKKQIKEIQDMVGGVQQQAEEQARSLDNLARKAAAGLAAYLSINAATSFLGEMVRVRGEFQQLEVAFTTMLQSKEKADKLLADVTKFAATTPFGLKEVATATKQLLAFGIAAEDIEKTLRMLGDVSAGIGAPIGEIAYLFGTIKTQGVALTQDVRQFAQRGIPVYEELAKVLNVSVEEVGNLITAGKVGFPEIQKVFENLTAEGSKFGGLMAEQAKTLTGQISNLQDAFAQMLNELGKSSQGVASDLISGVTTIVENYQKVLDIIKLLVVAYGSYRAAIIVTNTVQAISISLTKGYTAAELLRYHALLLSEKAMKLLNATLLKNPIALVVAALATLVAGLVIFGKQASKTITAQTLLAKAQEKSADAMAEQEAKIRPYVDALKNANLSEKERLDIYNKLKDIDPKIVEGLDAKTLSYDALTKNVNKYLEALRKQYALEASKEALQESIKIENGIRKQIEETKKAIGELDDKIRTGKDNRGRIIPVQVTQLAVEDMNRLIAKVGELKKDLVDQEKVSQELGTAQIETEDKKQEAKLRTLKVIDEEIKAEKEKQQAFSTTSEEYQKFQKKIDALEAERKKIVGESKAETKAAAAAENSRNTILEKRIDVLQRIAELERDANQTGLTEKERALDQINQKYDKQLQAIKDANREIEKFNKVNRKNPVPIIGQTETDRVNVARQTELNNLRYKQDAEKYLEAIREKQKAFNAFEQAQLSGNAFLAEQTRQTYGDQLEGFSTMVDYLKAEYDKLFDQLNFDGLDNSGLVARFEGVKKMLDDALKQADEAARQQQLDRFQQMLTDLQTFNQKRAAVIKKYNDLEATLEKSKGKFSPEEFESRRRALQNSRDQELNDLRNAAARESDLYQKLNEDIILFTRKQVKDRIKELEKLLRTSTTLTPEMRADIQSAIDKYGNLLDSTNKTANDFQVLADDLSQVGNSFSSLGSALEGVDSELADILGTLGEIVSVGASAASAIAQFASGNIIGGIAASINTIIGLFSIGKKARESRKKAEAEIAAFQTQVLQGEIDVNVLYRQRYAEQAKINKLKLDGLRAEQEALRKNQQENLRDYQRIFELLQNESSISGQKTKKKGGFLGIGRKTEVVDELSSLAGLNFEQLEKLFMEGRLTEKAKELFLTLQKLKEEGMDIEQALKDAREQAKEIFTGTTAQTIADSIVEGFKAGKRSAADFADDFQGLMQNALIQALQVKALEGPLNDFFDQFAADAESGGQLESSEIDRLQALYNSIIENAATQFEQLQDIANLNFSSSSGSGNALQGAIRGITESQAELLAGQFGGVRINGIEQLRVAEAQLRTQQNIEANTAKLIEMERILRRLELNGIKTI